ncbi:MAG: class I SAM-dependent methyltransferase [Patescibacteria group bacterium]
MLFHIIKQSVQGKTINRLLMNASLASHALHGKVLDLGAGNKRSSYFQFFKNASGYTVTSVDVSPERNPDVIADVEKGLPLTDASYDNVLCFNLLEHLSNPARALYETYRVLQPGGSLIGYVPFLVKYHADPHDYFRYTHQGLRTLFEGAGFTDISIQFIGRGPFTAGWSQVEFILPGFLRWVVTYTIFCLDAMLLRLKPVFARTYALGFTFTAKK